MCKETSTNLQSLFESTPPPSTGQDLAFDHIDATLLNARQVYKRGNVIQFILPKTGLLIPDSARLFFNLLFEGSSSTIRRMYPSTDINNIFSRVTLTYGRTVILEDIQEYGQLSQLFSVYTKPATRQLNRNGVFQAETLSAFHNGVTDTTHTRPFLHNPQGLSNVAMGQAPRRYMVNINLGIFQQEKPLPLMFMNEELRLNFYLQDQVQKFAFVQAGAVNVSGPVVSEFQLGMPSLRYRVYYPSLQLKNQIFNHISTGRFVLQWTSFQHQRFPLSSSQTNQTMIINTFRKRIKYALAVIRSEIDIDDPQADATSTYVSLDPHVPNTASAASTVDQSRRTSLKEYQWFYNNQAIPSQPVKVLGVHPAYTFDKTTQPTTTLYSVDDYYGSSGVEAFYYFRETLGLKKQTGPFVKDNPWVIQDAWHAGADTPVTTQFNLSQQTVTDRRAPCSFVIAGKFFDTVTLPDGTLQETTIDGMSLNSNLRLKLLFNGLSETGSPYSAPYPRMYLDVWVAYNVVCVINDLGEITLEQ